MLWQSGKPCQVHKPDAQATSIYIEECMIAVYLKNRSVRYAAKTGRRCLKRVL
ncbi:MAG: hypothetical protein QXQ11_05960 [Candidatus Bathyarchaeia archaeon]